MTPSVAPGRLPGPRRGVHNVGSESRPWSSLPGRKNRRPESDDHALSAACRHIALPHCSFTQRPYAVRTNEPDDAWPWNSRFLRVSRLRNPSGIELRSVRRQFDWRRRGITCPAHSNEFVNQSQSFRITVARILSGGPKNLPYSRRLCILPINDLAGQTGANPDYARVGWRV